MKYFCLDTCVWKRFDAGKTCFNKQGTTDQPDDTFSGFRCWEVWRTRVSILFMLEVLNSFSAPHDKRKQLHGLEALKSPNLNCSPVETSTGFGSWWRQWGCRLPAIAISGFYTLLASPATQPSQNKIITTLEDLNYGTSKVKLPRSS